MSFSLFDSYDSKQPERESVLAAILPAVTKTSVDPHCIDLLYCRIIKLHHKQLPESIQTPKNHAVHQQSYLQ